MEEAQDNTSTSLQTPTDGSEMQQQQGNEPQRNNRRGFGSKFEQRRQLVRGLAEQGFTVAEIARATANTMKISNSTIKNICKELMTKDQRNMAKYQKYERDRRHAGDAQIDSRSKRNMIPYPQEIVANIIQLLQQGLTYKEIRRQIPFAKESTISKICKSNFTRDYRNQVKQERLMRDRINTEVQPSNETATGFERDDVMDNDTSMIGDDSMVSMDMGSASDIENIIGESSHQAASVLEPADEPADDHDNGSLMFGDDDSDSVQIKSVSRIIGESSHQAASVLEPADDHDNGSLLLGDDDSDSVQIKSVSRIIGECKHSPI